jgi:hypothetical protein
MNSELIINLIVAGFTLLMIIYVEKVMNHFPLTQKEVDKYQTVLDKSKGDDLPKYDAFTELTNQRKQAKGFTLIFSGFFLAFVLIGLAFVTTLSFTNIGVICLSAITLICYGIIKLAESKKLAIGMLAVVFVMGTLAMMAFDKLMTLSPYAYIYLCGLVLLLGILCLLPRRKVKENQMTYTK